MIGSQSVLIAPTRNDELDAMTAEAEAEPSSTPEAPTVRRRTTFSSLRTRNFRLMAASQLISNIGWWMQYTALNWLVLSLTGSPAAVGLTAALQFAPTVVLGMAGGLLADRYPKRRILLVNVRSCLHGIRAVGGGLCRGLRVRPVY
ncbi:MFS transporter [Kribbella sp. NPDC050820]|uniref:MFS transporter n=1 Tax=Kribbella sp. NPDC050820 TaxID=3155408 RepID=UPI0033F2BD87